jgi:hypothetical protein
MYKNSMAKTKYQKTECRKSVEKLNAKTQNTEILSP